MKFLTELWGISRQQPSSSVEEPSLDIEHIRQKAAAHHAAQQRIQQDRGVMRPDQARAAMAKAQNTLGTRDLEQFKRAITALSNDELKKLFVQLKQAGDDALIRAKRQIVFDEITGGRRPERGYDEETPMRYDIGPRRKAAPFTFG